METRIRHITLLLVILVSGMAHAEIFSMDDAGVKSDIKETGIQRWNYNLRAGISIGGTVPVDMPAEMRHINSFSPKFNYRIGADVEYRLNVNWGLMAGLAIERRGFEGDMKVKAYQVTMRQGTEEISGPFTGNVVTNIVQGGLNIPVHAVWHINSKSTLNFGPYISLITSKSFNGYAYGIPDEDGHPTAYLRRDGPQGPLVYIGNDENSRGTFSDEEFKDYLRTFQWGVDAGFDYSMSRQWGLYADLSYGINGAFNDKEGNPVSMGLHPIYFTLGVTYKIGK